MRFFENLFIKLFALIVLIVSIVTILIGFGFLSLKNIGSFYDFLYSESLNAKITIVVCAILSLISVKILMTRRGKPKNGKDGIILENGNGRLIISKESLDNMIANAAKDVPGAENITSKTYLDLEQNLRVFVTVTVSSEISIKDLSTRLQNQIKSTIKQTADLDVSEVNVKIKNIVNKKAKKDRHMSKEIKEETRPEIITTNEVVEETRNEFNNEEFSNEE